MIPKEALQDPADYINSEIECPNCMSVIPVLKDPKASTLVDQWLSQIVKNYSLIQLVEADTEIPKGFGKVTKHVTFFDEPSIISDM